MRLVPLAIVALICSQSSAVAVTVPANWWSNADTTETSCVTQFGAEALRLSGGCTSGHIEGSVSLPMSSSWDIHFTIITDETFSLPNEFIHIFINGDSVASFKNTPVDQTFLFTYPVTGDQFNYRFEFGSTTTIFTRHMVMWPGCVSCCDDEINDAWIAHKDLLPDALGCAWRLTNTADQEQPILLAESLVLSTNQAAETMLYTFSGADTANPLPQGLVLEAKVKVDSCIANAESTCAAIALNRGPGTGNILWIGEEQVRLQTGLSVGSELQTANVPTTDGFHIYRLEACQCARSVRVFYDGNLILSGRTYELGTPDAIWWGDGNPEASGSSQWAWVRHNLAAAPCLQGATGAEAAVQSSSWARVKSMYR